MKLTANNYPSSHLAINRHVIQTGDFHSPYMSLSIATKIPKKVLKHGRGELDKLLAIKNYTERLKFVLFMPCFMVREQGVIVSLLLLKSVNIFHVQANSTNQCHL